MEREAHAQLPSSSPRCSRSAAAGCGEKDEPPTTGPVVAADHDRAGDEPDYDERHHDGQQATDDEEIKATVADFLIKPNAPGACTSSSLRSS